MTSESETENDQKSTSFQPTGHQPVNADLPGQLTRNYCPKKSAHNGPRSLHAESKSTNYYSSGATFLKSPSSPQQKADSRDVGYYTDHCATRWVNVPSAARIKVGLVQKPAPEEQKRQKSVALSRPWDIKMQITEKSACRNITPKDCIQ